MSCRGNWGMEKCCLNIWAKFDNIFWGKEKNAECPVVAIGAWTNVVKIFGQHFDNIFGGKEKKT